MYSKDVKRVIEDFSCLSLEDKEYVAQIMKKQIVEERREQILSRAAEARDAFDRGEVRMGGFQNLYEDLEDD